MSFIQLGKIINPTEFNQFIAAAEQMETVVHRYGGDLVIPAYPCWMEYKNEGGVVGSISFSRHTNSHPALKEMIQIVATALIPIFNGKPVLLERIHFMKTVGDVVAHRDEAGRVSCINIGIKNTSTAITRVSNSNSLSDFETNHTDYHVEEGSAYLLDVSNIHAVIGNNIPRYLITYGFGTPFNILSTHICSKHIDPINNMS